MTQPISADALLAQLQWRYAVKKFDATKKIPAADWAALEQSLILSASSYGLQPYRFVVVEDPAVRAQLPALSWGQTQTTDASHFVVFARRLAVTTADVDRYLARIAQVRGIGLDALAGLRGMLVGDIIEGPRSQWAAEWAARQAYIALGFLLTSAAALGIDACPMEGFSPADYDKVLGLEAQGLGAVCACALGYRASDDPYATAPKVRLPADELILKI